LQPIGSEEAVPARRIKRESGENPGQSRCCEALFKTHRQSVCHWLQHREGVDARVSQKTCHRFLLLTGLVEKTVETNIEQTLISQISFRRQ